VATASQPQKEKTVSTFVAEIRKRLVARDMTISELAELAEVGRPYIHRVLTGEQTPTVEWMEKVGKILGMSIKVTVK